jgi:hypothetical protein
MTTGFPIYGNPGTRSNDRSFSLTSGLGAWGSFFGASVFSASEYRTCTPFAAGMLGLFS